MTFIKLQQLQRVPPQRKRNYNKTQKLLLVPVLLLCVGVISFTSHFALSSHGFNGQFSQERILQRSLRGREDTKRKAPSKPITFQACNGFANQRLSIVFGILAGILTERDVLMPQLPLNGEQRKGSGNVHAENTQDSVLFSQFYDLGVLRQMMSKYNVRLLNHDFLFKQGEVFHAECSSKSVFECLESVQNVDKIVNIGCGFPSNLISPVTVLEHQHVLDDILQSLVPVKKYQKEIDRALKVIKEWQSGKRGFNFLHLRVEEDWVEHCEVWTKIPDGVIRDNCMGDLAEIGTVLEGMIEDTAVPLIVSHSTNVHNDTFQTAMQSIVKSNFNIISNQDLQLDTHFREVSALIDYYLALQANQFIGNSVSSFSALLILERRSMYKWASYYNKGNIPMIDFLPLYKVPWILVDECSDEKFFNSQVLPTLIQGMMVGRLDAYLFCYTNQPISKSIIEAAESNFVTVIQYQDIVNLMISYGIELNRFEFYYQVVMILQLRQYNYAILTDTNVWFERQIKLSLFGLPLPKFQIDYNLGGEEKARVKLINTQYIREQWFIRQLFSDHSEQGIIRDGGLSGVVKYTSDMTLDASITTEPSKPSMDKWASILNCQYKEYQLLYGPNCQNPTTAQ
eukprot:TRINITY_DN2823_c0_g1_i2.p1 TRINITY_DN2823_c0_g1~~TRINITY_DN2823_c0_g1_i2.p1  ORF type:complete len:636 (+),score=41.53 TRINITY_DN2823_c0_g1_i2:36-1910(+)